MSLIGRLLVRLGLDNREFKKGIDESQSKTSAFTSKIKGMGAAILASFSVGAVISFAKKAIGAYNQQALAISKVEAVLKSTGHIAGLTSRELQRYASELQKYTTFGDEVTLDAMSKLLTFKSIQGEVFKETIKSAQDLATIMGTDLNSAVMQLGKALEQPEVGLTMLRRSGISFTQQQIEGIKKLVEEGKKQEAQWMILAEVQSQFGGAAKKVAQESVGVWTQVTNAFGDLLEALGKGIDKTKSFGTATKLLIEQMTNVISSERLSFWDKLAGLLTRNVGVLVKANKEIRDNDLYWRSVEQNAKAYVDTITSVAQAEKALENLKVKTDTDREIQKLLTSYIAQQKAIEETNKELQKQKSEIKSGLIPTLEEEIKIKQRLIDFEKDPEKIRALNSEIQLIKNRLDFLKMTAEQYRIFAQYRDNPLESGGQIRGGAQTSVSDKGLRDRVAEQSELMRKANEEFMREQEKMEEIATLFEHSIKNIIGNSIEHLTDVIAGTSNLNTGQLVAALLMPLADMAISAGTIILFTGDAIEKLKKGLMTFLGIPAIAAGAALIGVGAAAKIGLKALAKPSGGGNASTNTFAGGIVSPNFGQQDTTIRVEGVIVGSDILISNERAQLNRMR